MAPRSISQHPVVLIMGTSDPKEHQLEDAHSPPNACVLSYCLQEMERRPLKITTLTAEMMGDH